MMVKSSALCKALGSSGLYITSLVRRLLHSEAIVLKSLLEMLQLMHQHHPSPRQLVLDNDLYSIIRKFAEVEGQVLVFQVANKLLKDFQQSTMS